MRSLRLWGSLLDNSMQINNRALEQALTNKGFLFLGAPGAGKTTQASRLASRANVDVKTALPSHGPLDKTIIDGLPVDF
eukprot:gene9952-429_t